jgi:hypothetical protein
LITNKIVYAEGLLLGLGLSLFLIETFSVRNVALEYPILIFGSMVGIAAYFSTEMRFVGFSSLVGSLIALQGFSTFLTDQYPSFIANIQSIA